MLTWGIGKIPSGVFDRAKTNSVAELAGLEGAQGKA
jgi:hypothetical protein